MTSSADVTLYILTLGDADSITGWYEKAYGSGVIKMIVRPKGSSFNLMGVGLYAKYDNTGFTADAVSDGDVVEDSNGMFYLVRSTQEEWWLDTFSHYVCDLAKRDFSDQPTTSGTWHLDSDALTTDPRSRHKIYLDGNLVATHLKKDNGTTNADYITCFDEPPYPMKRVFLTKGIDLVFSIGKEDAKQLTTYNHYPYAFEESVPITVSAVNKSDVTGTNLVEQAEQEIRRIITALPLGSIRSIDTVKHKPVDLGATQLYSSTVTVKYIRPNDDYVPTAPAFDYGVGFTYEGDRLTGGVEGTWDVTNHKGAATATFTINSENNLVLTTDGADEIYTHNGTELGSAINTTTYTKIRWRYKRTGNTGAKIVVTYHTAAAQTVLIVGASNTFTVGSATLTPDDHIHEIQLYASAAAGTVVYDFIEIFSDTYILPNVTNMSPPLILQDAVIPIPGRLGSINQALGSGSMEIRMTCDLDMEHTNLKWKRDLTGAPCDVNNIDILLETAHRGGGITPWIWLDIGDPAMQFKTRLVEVNPAYSEAGNTVELVWREYRHGTAGNETTSERFGLSL